MDQKRNLQNENGQDTDSNAALQVLFTAGLRHQKAVELEEAERIYRQILQAHPRHAHTLHMMGIVAFDLARYAEAEELVKKALAERDDIPMFHYTMGRILIVREKPDEGIAHYKRALEEKPEFVDCLNALANALLRQGKIDEAMEYYARVTSIKPDENAFVSIGHILQGKGQPELAAAHYLRALTFLPNSMQILNNLGIVNSELIQYEDAIKHYKRALAIEPKDAQTLANLANAYKNLGQLEESIACNKRALGFSPQPWIYSNLFLTMVYAASVSPEELAAETRAFGEKIAAPLLRARPLIRDKNPERRLRVGYVSPDFNQHPVNYFFEPLLKLHDRKQFEIFAYSNTAYADSVTERLKKNFDHWRDIQYISDDAAADLIEKDEIDILIDMAGHTGRNRLLVFARKPAPIQTLWLGYPATTGMKAMDYRITDVYAEPEGMTEHLNVEKLWRLPDIFCCYQPHENSPEAIDHPPYEDNGYVTFGCFNNFSKVTDNVLKAWAEIMKRVPDSRLLLEIREIHDPKIRAETDKRLRALGLPMERVILEPRKRSNQFVLYNKIDIALDPFPCNGGTTSMDTVWMGVPFVTLAGKHFVSRMGVTILTNAGLKELIAENIDEYITLSAELAQDRERLRKIRMNLREKVVASPVMDQKRFARAMENAYRGMWRRWASS